MSASERPLWLRLLLPGVPRPVSWTVNGLSLLAAVLLLIDPARLLWWAVAVLGLAGALLYGTAAWCWWRGA